MKTDSGAVELARPRVRDAQRLGFESKVLGKGVARTHALESLVICSFLRGLSVRDVEATLSETFEEPVVSKSTVARVCRDTPERYRQWCERCSHPPVALPWFQILNAFRHVQSSKSLVPSALWAVLRQRTRAMVPRVFGFEVTPSASAIRRMVRPDAGRGLAALARS